MASLVSAGEKKKAGKGKGQMTESKRQQKYAKLILKDLGEIFHKSGSKYYGNAFVTVTEVKMTPDLKMAKVYISAMMVTDKTKLIQDLNDNKGELRGVLGSKIGKQVRAVPDLSFFIDNTLDQAAKMDELFKGLEIPPEDEK